MKKWISRRLRMRYCVAEHTRGDLRVQVFRVPTAESKAKPWLRRLVVGDTGYEYRLEFARRGVGKKYDQFKEVASLRHVDMARVVELYGLADLHLHTSDHQRMGKARKKDEPPSPAQRTETPGREVPKVKVVFANYEVVSMAYRAGRSLDVVVHRHGDPAGKSITIHRGEFLPLAFGLLRAWAYTRKSKKR